MPHVCLCTKKILFKPYNSFAPIFQMWKFRHWERAEPGFKTKEFYSIVHIFLPLRSLLSIIQGPSTHKLYGFKMKALVKILFGLHYKKAKQNLLPWIKSSLVFTPGHFSSLIYGHSASLFLEVKWSEVAQSYLTLCNPMDCSLPGVHGILQARILEGVAISFSMGSSWPRDWTWVSRIGGRRFNLWTTREAHLFHIGHVFLCLNFFVDMFLSSWISLSCLISRSYSNSYLQWHLLPKAPLTASKGKFEDSSALILPYLVHLPGFSIYHASHSFSTYTFGF